MEQTDLEVLSRFEEVWQRVQQGKPAQQTQPEHGGVEMLMDRLHYQWCGFRQLAACTCGTEKHRLLGLAEGIKKQFLRLQLEYFLKKGDIYITGDSPNFASYTPYNLRKLWQSTVENVETMKKCNLNDDVCFVAESSEMEELFRQQKREIETLICMLLR